MKQIKWQTAKGIEVELTLETSETVTIDGHTFERPIYRLRCLVFNPCTILDGVTAEPHPTAGLVLRSGNKLVSVNTEVANQVQQLVDEYHAEADHRMAKWIAEERAYEADTNKIYKAMGE